MSENASDPRNEPSKSPPKETHHDPARTNGVPQDRPLSPKLPKPEEIPDDIATMQFNEPTLSDRLDHSGTNNSRVN